MNDLDAKVLIFGSILVFALVGAYLFLCVLLWRKLSGLRALLVLAFLAIGAGTIWAYLGAGVGLLLSFGCPSCFRLGTPTSNAYSLTFGLPFRDSALPFGDLNFPIIVAALYLLGLIPALFRLQAQRQA
jgi:hypothetical protein